MDLLGRIRDLFQLATLFLANGYWKVLSTGQIYKGPLKGTCLPILNCHSCPTALTSCPIGVLQHFVAIHQIPYFLLGLFGAVGLLVGRMACGWLCPFGYLQDLLHRLRTVKYQLPESLHLLRFGVLGLLVLILPYTTGENWFSILCPQGTLTAAVPWVLWNPLDPVAQQPLLPPGSVGGLFAIKVLILIAFLLLFVLVKRPFCRTVCPLGLIFSFFNRISIVRLEVDAGCQRCGHCRDTCPVDIQVHDNPNSSSCIRCLKCTACPHVRCVARLPLAPSINQPHHERTGP